MSSVWTEHFVEEGNLNKNISMLRRVLGEGENGQKFIETVPKRGFRFVADVRQVNDYEETDSTIDVRATARLVSEGNEASGFQETASALPPTLVRTRSRNWLGIAFIAVFLVAVLVYVTSIRKSRNSVTPTITSIVVLPLQNLSSDPAQEYFVDGWH